MKPTLTFKLLKKLYHIDNLTIKSISEKTGHSSSSICRKIAKYGLKKDKSKVYDQINQTRKETFQFKYGSDHYMKSDKGYSTYRDSLKKNYSVTSIMHLNTIKNKVKDTHLKRYGVEYSIQNPKSNNKRLKTLKERYGNFSKYMSKKSSDNHIATSPTIETINTLFGDIKVRSKLEKNIILKLNNFDIKSLQYEPISIETQDFYIIPDLLINQEYIIEVKYSKYLNKSLPKNLDSRGISMWQSAQKKLPLLQEWCQKNKFKFLIATEIHAKKKHETLDEFISDLNIYRSD